MADVNKIDSNITGLTIAEESSMGVLPGTPVWEQFEPNTYSDFGGEITTVARNPINPSRQRKKGVTTDLDASGGFNTDLTQTNLQGLLQGLFFADLREKGDLKNPIGITTLTISATATGSVFTRVGGSTDLTTLFNVGDTVFVSGFVDDANNGFFRADAVAATTLDVTLADGAQTAATLVDEAATSDASIIKIGFESDVAGDIDVDLTGTLPQYTSTTFDFTTLGLVPGEWIFVGGDVADTQFSSAVNNGFKRIRAISATALEVDKSDSTMVTEASTTENIQMFIGRALKNELSDDIVRRTYQMERELGAPDDALPLEVQSEYLVGSVLNEGVFNYEQADKINVDLSFIAIDNEQRTGATGQKTGTRPTLVDSDAFNTSSDFSRINLAIVSDSDAAPDPLFAFAQSITITFNNNASPNKAIGTLGAFDVTAGTFQVSGSLTAYFANVTAVQAVRNNSDVTIDYAVVKDNAGFVMDLPLISLGDGRLNVEQDQPITLPLSMDAATAAKIDETMDYTAMMNFYDYLPDLADT